MAVEHLTKENFDEFIQGDKVIVDFWATWCGPCRMQAPILENLAAQEPNIAIGKVDVDHETELAARFGIMSIPTLLAFKNGKQVGKLVGVSREAALKSLFD